MNTGDVLQKRCGVTDILNQSELRGDTGVIQMPM